MAKTVITYEAACPECEKAGQVSRLTYDYEAGSFVCEAQSHFFTAYPENARPLADLKETAPASAPKKDKTTPPKKTSAVSTLAKPPEPVPADLTATAEVPPEPSKEPETPVSEPEETPPAVSEPTPASPVEAPPTKQQVAKVASMAFDMQVSVRLPGGDHIVSVRVPEWLVTACETEAERQNQTFEAYMQEFVVRALENEWGGSMTRTIARGVEKA